MKTKQRLRTYSVTIAVNETGRSRVESVVPSRSKKAQSTANEVCHICSAMATSDDVPNDIRESLRNGVLEVDLQLPPKKEFDDIAELLNIAIVHAVVHTPEPIHFEQDPMAAKICWRPTAKSCQDDYVPDEEENDDLKTITTSAFSKQSIAATALKKRKAMIRDFSKDDIEFIAKLIRNAQDHGSSDPKRLEFEIRTMLAAANHFIEVKFPEEEKYRRASLRPTPTSLQFHDGTRGRGFQNLKFHIVPEPRLLRLIAPQPNPS